MRAASALALGLAALVLAAPAAAADVHQGRQLYLDGCSTCHGLNAQGVEGTAPSLHGVGAAAADFYLSTGRMPLAQPGEQPERGRPAYSREQIDDLVAYVASLGPGPPIPDVHPEQGDVVRGLRLFESYCMGCHQIAGEGGVITDATVPELNHSTPTEIGEAIRVGPYLMPDFDQRTLSDQDVNDIARYVTSVAQHEDDSGGWGLGHIGPVPEGMVTWWLAAAVLVIVIRMLGERSDE